MTTFIRFRRKDNNYRTYQVNYRTMIYVYGFEDGIVEVRACPGMSIEEFAQVIEGCFASLSNFAEEIIKDFNPPLGTKLKGIKVVFNDIHVCTATKEYHNAKDIVSKYFEKKK